MTVTAINRRWILLITALISFLFASSIAVARDSRTIFSAPNGWEEISHKRTDSREITHYLPFGEDSQDWSQMITLIKLKETGESALFNLINETVRTSLVNCNEPPMRRGRFLDNLTLESGYIAETACDKVDAAQAQDLKKNELLRVFIKEHRGDIYLVKYSWHHQELSARARFDDPALVNKFNKMISDLQ